MSVNLGLIALEKMWNLQKFEPARQMQAEIDIHMTVEADASLMRIALTQLQDNVWKFSSGNTQTHIEMNEILMNGCRIFCIKDSGAGFDEAHMYKRFKVFQRLHNLQEFSGNGTGLAAVKRIVERHDGRIWASSIPGQGAKYFFTLKVPK